MRSAWRVLLVFAAASASAVAQERGTGENTVIAAPAAQGGDSRVQVAVPSPPPPDFGRHPASVPVPAAAGARAAARPTAFGAIQARDISAGRARLSWAGGERIVRPGDSLDGAIVKSVEPGRVVLTRAGSAAAEDLIV